MAFSEALWLDDDMESEELFFNSVVPVTGNVNRHRKYALER